MMMLRHASRKRFVLPFVVSIAISMSMELSPSFARRSDSTKPIPTGTIPRDTPSRGFLTKPFLISALTIGATEPVDLWPIASAISRVVGGMPRTRKDFLM